MCYSVQQKQKWPNKDEPTVEDLFILTHTPKDGRPVTKAAADAIVRHEKLNSYDLFFIYVEHAWKS